MNKRHYLAALQRIPDLPGLVNEPDAITNIVSLVEELRALETKVAELRVRANDLVSELSKIQGKEAIDCIRFLYWRYPEITVDELSRAFSGLPNYHKKLLAKIEELQTDALCECGKRIKIKTRHDLNELSKLVFGQGQFSRCRCSDS